MHTSSPLATVDAIPNRNCVTRCAGEHRIGEDERLIRAVEADRERDEHRRVHVIPPGRAIPIIGHAHAMSVGVRGAG
ncbi:hypothetical protein [Burkholderia latens]|uniref:hypothetical protein n=1 Tax=Burkholderia latens TaxID=488446 RepID=UPI001ABA1FB2|nr:hypothetical protein [Burkholderia latens]